MTPIETATALSLEDFLLEAMRRRVDRNPVATLAALVERLDLPRRLIDGYVRFEPAGYQRRLGCRTAVLDLLVLSWMPGHESAIHDHAGSRGVVRVHAGTLTSRVFTANGACPELVQEDLAPAGATAAVEVGDVHQLANTSGGELVTVHCYAPPLVRMNAYERGRRVPRTVG